MPEIRDDLKPHRNQEAEKQLKLIIQDIEALMCEPENETIIESKLKEAAEFVKSPDRVLDLTVIENYESWTDLDGLVGELTMEAPKRIDISEKDFIALVQWIRENVVNGTDDIDLQYYFDFYKAFFELNFPDKKEINLFEEIFEDTPVDKLIDFAFHN